MFPRIVKVEHLQDYRLKLTFADGKQGVVDFRRRIVGRGGVFKPLEDVSYFQRVDLDPDFRTLVWPNGVDFDPDVLYSEATGIPLPEIVPTT
jgi:hypothetical protein